MRSCSVMKNSPVQKRTGLCDYQSSVNATMSLGVHWSTLQSFSMVFKVMLLLRFRLVIVYALKPFLYIRV